MKMLISLFIVAAVVGFYGCDSMDPGQIMGQGQNIGLVKMMETGDSEVSGKSKCPMKIMKPGKSKCPFKMMKSGKSKCQMKMMKPGKSKCPGKKVPIEDSTSVPEPVETPQG